jgi:hypothetical protein
MEGNPDQVDRIAAFIEKGPTDAQIEKQNA